MSYSEILVPVAGGPEDASALECASALAGAFGSRAVAVFPQADPRDALMWSTEGFYTAMPEAVLEAAQNGAEEAWNRIGAAVGGHPGLVAEHVVGQPDMVLAQRAALSDLAVFSCESARGKGLLSGAFETLLMSARTPVLIPRQGGLCEAGGFGGPVVVAWDGGDSAARAVRGALPFLKAAATVVIVQAKVALEAEARRFAEPERLVTYLDGHGVHSEVQVLDGSGSPAELVLEAASGRAAKLLVTGAYGHSRLREFVFGGATRRFLAATAGPSMLLSH